MKLATALYFALIGYYIAKSHLDESLWAKACEAHDRWVLHVTNLARKELT